MFPKYNVIVVGAGHAGCEAAAAAANRGSKVLLVTMNMQTIAQMSCNPAMGGIAKGQIVREIDALGGYSGIVSDLSTIQFRMLNKSKGPAMWSPRTQNDRHLFASKWRELLEQTPNVDFYQDSVNELIIKNETDNFLLMADTKEDNDTDNNIDNDETDILTVTSNVTNHFDTNSNGKEKHKNTKKKKSVVSL